MTLPENLETEVKRVNKTGYFTHPDCRKHEMGRGHPECPERLDAIEDRLLISGVGDVLDRRGGPVAPRPARCGRSTGGHRCRDGG